jgi:hypothetical protein
VGGDKLVSALAESVKPRMGQADSSLTQFQDVLLNGLKGGSAENGMQVSKITGGGEFKIQAE